MGHELSVIIMHVLQGVHDEDELRVFLEWIHASNENKEFYFELKHLYEQRKGGLEPSKSEIMASWERLQRKAKGRSRKISRKLQVWRVAGIAVVLLMVVGLSVYLVNSMEVSVEWVEVSTDALSEPKTILLPDGSIAQLNASSVFRYPATFDKNQREVYLDGEGYFTVAKDKQRPFIVHTDKQQVKVLGTEFNLMAYSTDPYTITTLVSGSVQLEIFDVSENNKSVVLNPGQQVFFDKALQETVLTEVDPGYITSWLNGVYMFRDTPLEQITRRLEKIHGVTFIIAEEELSNEQYTGKFFLDQTLEEVVQVLNFKGNYRIEHIGNSLYLRNK